MSEIDWKLDRWELDAFYLITFTELIEVPRLPTPFSSGASGAPTPSPAVVRGMVNYVTEAVTVVGKELFDRANSDFLHVSPTSLKLVMLPLTVSKASRPSVRQISPRTGRFCL